MTAAEQTAKEVRELALAAKQGALQLARATTAHKDAVLLRLAVGIQSRVEEILRENTADMVAARESGISESMLDRLLLDEKRIESVVDGVRQIADLPDPVGSLEGRKKLANGLDIAKMRIPLGLIGIIYESRPNVTIDAAALCIKSGNAVILRGGKEAFRTNTIFAEILGNALEQEGLARECACLIPTIDRSASLALIQLDGIVDLVIPRGGEGLIRFVSENSRVPVIRHYKGMCHVFIDTAADLEKAIAIVLNSKVQRPSACNSAETLLVDSIVAPMFVPPISEALKEAGVLLHVGPRAAEYVPDADTSPDWDKEHLSMEMNIALVDGIEGAIAHIQRHGSLHTESIVTEDKVAADRWLREVDASVVLVNASTRFNDGQQLGLGAEMGISTTKLHAYGPMGLEELCTLKWVVRGTGQVRT